MTTGEPPPPTAPPAVGATAPAPPLGRLRGLAACASARGTFAILALDHRQALRRELDPADPASVTYAQMVGLKRAVVRALSTVADAILLDPEIGLATLLDGSFAGRGGLLLAVEATGYEGLSTTRRSRILPGWSVEQAKRAGASAVKLLVHYHPEASTADAQERLVDEVWRECLRLDLPLFVEPLSFSTDPAVPRLTGEARRRVVVETARRLGAVGMDVLKAEFPYDPGVADEAAWADACAELTAVSPVPWVLLSAGVDDATFRRQATIACRAGASGVLVGRSVWAEAATLPPDERDAFLATTGRGRLRDLQRLCDELGRPWTAGSPLAQAWLAPDSTGGGDLPPEGWFARYPGFR